MEEDLQILLVEDDPRDLRLTMRELKAHLKGRIEVARDGEEALDFLFCRGEHADRSPQHPPRLIVLDLKLPKVDGFQVLREIKAHPETQAIPVVALTSSREERDMIESYHLGVNSYVPKPVDFGKFRDTIRALGLYWLEVNHPAPKKAFKV
jgi:DNA-binding response OmpR family regulator